MRDQAKIKVVNAIATRLQAVKNCQQSGNKNWEDSHRYDVEDLVREYMPSGSGFDSGTTLDEENSNNSVLVFTTSFHHMDGYGGYLFWSDLTVRIKASLVSGFVVEVELDLDDFIDGYSYIKDTETDEFDEIDEEEIDDAYVEEYAREQMSTFEDYVIQTFNQALTMMIPVNSTYNR